MKVTLPTNQQSTTITTSGPYRTGQGKDRVLTVRGVVKPQLDMSYLSKALLEMAKDMLTEDRQKQAIARAALFLHGTYVIDEQAPYQDLIVRTLGTRSFTRL